MEKGYDGEFV